MISENINNKIKELGGVGGRGLGLGLGFYFYIVKLSLFWKDYINYDFKIYIVMLFYINW